MQTLYLPYEVTFDEGSLTYCCTGLDRHGKVFGVGSGSTPEKAEQRLREAVFVALLADAADGNDYTSDLFRTPQGDNFLLMGPLDLLPIRIRLARFSRHYKQIEVAERMGISQQAYARLERTGANPTLALLARLEKALQQDILQMA